MWYSRLLLAGLTPMVLACTTARGPFASDAGVAPESDARVVALAPTWVPCTLYSDGRGPGAECATVDVPLDWSTPDRGRLPLFVKRYRAKESRGQLWLLQGGPGGASNAFEPMAHQLVDQLGVKLDVYMLDHRGVGRSARLGCPAEEATDSPGGARVVADEQSACFTAMMARYGDQLPYFSTTQAATDLGRLIAATRGARDRIYVYGVSYGTYWAHRYLQIYPQQPTATVLDSVCAPTTCRLNRYDDWFDQLGRTLLDACGNDSACAARLGTAAQKKADEIFRRLAAGHCSQLASGGIDRARLRRAMGRLLTIWTHRTAIPPLLYRIDRCRDDDIDAIRSLIAAVDEIDRRRRNPLDSAHLFAHVSLSELWDEPGPAPEALSARTEQALFSLGASSGLGRLASSWPKYPRDRHHGRWAETSSPLLMLNGTLDPQTPPAVYRVAAAGLAGPAHYFVEVPAAAHNVLYQSPTTNAGLACGMEVFLSFIADPQRAPDTSCIERLAQLTFGDNAALAKQLFGTASLWD